MRFVDVIEKKARGRALTEEEIRTMVEDYTAGRIPDYQMSAMLMAIRLKGMTARETALLTEYMMLSGDLCDLSDLPGIKVDKHSTGGVGDTTTLVVVPLAAACGATVAKMSGRGLGHTGGTLDKLESVPGVCVEQSAEALKAAVRKNGAAVVGQTGNLVPADKMMYALRDVTATVKSIPLIAASVMSKKLASGADAMVLDVKVGSGAFMKTPEDAEKLARRMVNIGRSMGRRVSAIVTDMDQPLGLAIGNALEMREAVELLSGKIPNTDPLYRVCMLLGVQMLLLSDITHDEEEAEAMLTAAIADGRGLAKLREMIRALGGDESYISVKGMEKLCAVKRKVEIRAEQEGYIGPMEAEGIGTAAQLLGAGRATKEDTIDPAVGLVMAVRRGDRVKKGDLMCTMYVNREDRLQEAMDLFRASVPVVDEQQQVPPMVYALITE